MDKDSCLLVKAWNWRIHPFLHAGSYRG